MQLINLLIFISYLFTLCCKGVMQELVIVSTVSSANSVVVKLDMSGKSFT